MHLLIVVSSKTTWIENVQTLCREHHFRVPAVVTAIAPAETHFHHENFSTLILIMFLPSCQRRDISFQTKWPILTIGRNSFRTMLYSTNTYQSTQLNANQKCETSLPSLFLVIYVRLKKK